MSTRKQRRRSSPEETPTADSAALAPVARKKAPPAPPPSAPVDPAEEWRAQRRLSLIGFALVGLLMGFLAGANQPIDVPDSASALVQASRVGVAVASHTAEWGRGLSAGVMGVLVGGSFGYSLFLSPGVMVLSWLGGMAGLAAGLATGLAVVGGVGWAGGFLAVLLAAVKTRLGEV